MFFGISAIRLKYLTNESELLDKSYLITQ